MPWVTPQIFIAEAVFQRQYLEAQARVRALEKAAREKRAAEIEEQVRVARATRNAGADDIEYREVHPVLIPLELPAPPELPSL